MTHDGPGERLYKSNSDALVPFSVSVWTCGTALHVNRARASHPAMVLAVTRTLLILPMFVPSKGSGSTNAGRCNRPQCVCNSEQSLLRS